MPDRVTNPQRGRRGQAAVAIEPKYFAAAAELEQAVYRTGRTIGRTWPWLSMAIDMGPDCDTHDPLLSMARSAAHALRRAGLRLESPLITIPEPDDAEVVLGWCRRVGRHPNSHWAGMAVLVQLDELLALKSMLKDAAPAAREAAGADLARQLLALTRDMSPPPRPVPAAKPLAAILEMSDPGSLSTGPGFYE